MPNHVSLPRDRTDLLYSRALARGQRAMFWAALTGRSRCLLALEEVRQEGCLASIEQSHFSPEARLVPPDQILGSGGAPSRISVRQGAIDAHSPSDRSPG